MLRRARARHRRRRSLLPLAIGLGIVVVLGGLIGAYKLYTVYIRHAEAVQAADAITTRRQRHIAEQAGFSPVAMLGDSITAQGNWPELVGSGVANVGQSGDTTVGIAERAAMLPPTVRTVFLMGGINDLRTGASNEETAQNLENIVADLQPRRVYLESTLLTSDSDLNQRVDDLNVRLHDFCESGTCTFVDLNSVLAPTGTLLPEMTVDGTHLKPAAYTLWAQRIAPLLAAERAAARH